MSRKATKEYIGNRRRAYAKANRQKRHDILDAVCDTTGYERKYALKLLTGNRKFRDHKGRGITYGPDVRDALIAIWRETGCICTTYLQLDMARWVEDYSTHVSAIGDAVKTKLLAMSATTMDRMLKGVKRVKTGSVQKNRRSGVNNELKNAIPCVSGEVTMACNVPPGDAQVDTFAMGGGDAGGNYFWILDVTDRRTQWTWLSPTWNRGEYATMNALKHIIARFPFTITSLHADNGGEIVNYHLARNLPKLLPKSVLLRSRPRKCNDNAHVEEKNRHVGRDLFGERRLDNPDLQKDLVRLCDEWSLFCNFCRPSKMLVSKEKRPDGKGSRCRYDRPRTPCDRVLEDPGTSEEMKEKLLKIKASISGIELRHRLVKRLRRIIRRQDEYASGKREEARIYRGAAASGSSLRDAPSGTPPAVGTPVELGGVSLAPKPESRQSIKEKSVQYLTNQKQTYLSKGVFPT